MASQVSCTSRAAGRRVHPRAPRPRPRITLSKEAREALKLDQREKSRRFREDLDNAWKSVNNVTQTLASRHHKSIRRVQNELYFGHPKFCSRRNKINAWNAFCWKKRQFDRKAPAVNGSNENGIFYIYYGGQRVYLSCSITAAGSDTLPRLVKDNRTDYHKLSTKEKEQLVEELAEFKKSVNVGTRTTMRSKVNDISHTLKAVENEVG